MTATDTKTHGAAADLFRPEVLSDPWDVYARLRDEAPVAFMPSLQMYVVTRFDLVMEALRAPEVFSSNFGPMLDRSRKAWLDAAPAHVRESYLAIIGKMLPPFDTMLTADDPVHARYRTLVNRVFAAGNIRRMEGPIREICDRRIETFRSGGRMEFVSAFAGPMPLEVIADRLGVPQADRDFFYDAATVIAARLRLTVPDEAEVLRRARVVVELQDYILGLVAERRRKPADDMCTMLGAERLEDEGGRLLNDVELWSILNQFLVAGHETTTSTLGFGMRNLCADPDLQARLRREPAGIKTFVEETLRLDAPVQGLPRLVKQDTVLGGQALKAGDWVMLRYGAANRDERQFACPMHLDTQRKNATAHLSFSNGAHYCVGAPLARQELNVGFARLLESFERFEFDPDQPPPAAEPSFLLRSLPQLNLVLTPRS